MKLYAPAGTTGCSFAGQEYEVDKDGTVDVPDDAVALLDFGFSTTPPAPPKKGRSAPAAADGDE